MARRAVSTGLATALVALIGPFVPPNIAVAEEGPLIEGLEGPLGLAVGDDGTVYVAEAFAGRLTSIDRRGRATVLVDAPGQEVAGVDAKGKGTAVFVQTLFDGAPGEEAPPLDSIVARVKPNGKTSTVASTQSFEMTANPDGGATYGFVEPSADCLGQVDPFFPGGTYPGIVESHPYAVAIAGDGYLVADAAANAIFRVSKDGVVSTAAVLPSIPQTITEATVEQLAADGLDISACLGETFLGEPVPTDIEVGPDGAWYVSTLPGFPEQPGAGAVFRVDPATGNSVMVAGGLNGAVDIAVDRDGSIVVAELFAFQITRLSPTGDVLDSVFADSPGAVEIARDGTVYAAVGVFGPNGSVTTIDI